MAKPGNTCADISNAMSNIINKYKPIIYFEFAPYLYREFGYSPKVLIDFIKKELNYTFCMIEHDIEFISKLCDPVIVMAEGSILMIDEISKVKENDKVIEVYLGKN